MPSRPLRLMPLLACLTMLSCVSLETIKKPHFRPFLEGKSVSEEALSEIKIESPKDAVFADLLQAFALMRTADLSEAKTRQIILGHLITSVNSFEDMADPGNFNPIFSADESKPFRGLPHERMFASLMTAVFLMGENNCARALPYLRNAEFLDARFQKMPFGTDAPMVYALMYRCLVSQSASAKDIERAADGIYFSLRFLSMQDVLMDALVRMSDVDLRGMAITNRLAYMIYEVSIYHSLMTAAKEAGIDELIDDAKKNASLFINVVNDHLADDFKERMKPLIDELARVYGMNNKAGREHLKDLALGQMSREADTIAANLKTIFARDADFKSKFLQREQRVKEIFAEIIEAVRAEKMIISFSGQGPTLRREGSYNEITVIEPSASSKLKPAIPEMSFKVSTACGFHRLPEGGFSLTLCDKNAKNAGAIKELSHLGLLGLSHKATTAQGRSFERVLKGRAQFRAATETAAEIGAWSAFFLFYMGANIMAECQRYDRSEACYAKGLAVWGAAGVTAIFSGTVWLVGRTVNPAADSRYIPMFEWSWISKKL